MPGFARNVHAFHCLWHFCAGGLFTCHCKGFLADANSWKRILRRTLYASVERKRAFHSHHQSTTDKKREKTLRIPIQHAASCESVKRSIRRFHPRSLASTRRLRWRGELKSWTLTSPTEGGSISPFLFFLIHCNPTQSTLSLGTRPPCFLSFSRLTSVLASPDEWLEGLLIHYKLSPDE